MELGCQQDFTICAEQEVAKTAIWQCRRLRLPHPFDVMSNLAATRHEIDVQSFPREGRAGDYGLAGEVERFGIPIQHHGFSCVDLKLDAVLGKDAHSAVDAGKCRERCPGRYGGQAHAPVGSLFSGRTERENLPGHASAVFPWNRPVSTFTAYNCRCAHDDQS